MLAFIDFVNIATAGDAADFGDLTVARSECGSSSNSVRGLWWNASPGHSDVIDFVTIASAGNATDFGNSVSRDAILGGMASQTRAVSAGGNNSGTRQNRIEYVSIMSTGNAIDPVILIFLFALPTVSVNSEDESAPCGFLSNIICLKSCPTLNAKDSAPAGFVLNIILVALKSSLASAP